MAFEKLKAAPGKLWNGVKEHFSQMGTGVAGGVLDTVGNGLYTITKGIGNACVDVMNGITQPVVRSFKGLADFFSVRSGYFLDPRVLVAQAGLGIQRGFESFVEADRSLADAGYNLTNVVSRGVARSTIGLVGVDVARHPASESFQQTLNVEAVYHGEPNEQVGRYSNYFSGRVAEAVENAGGPQPEAMAA